MISSAAWSRRVERPRGSLGGGLDGERVVSFREKPELEGWARAGCFVLERSALAALEGPEQMMEQAPLRKLAEAGELAAYRHRGFWQPMDTYREYLLLNEMWERGEAPWTPRASRLA